MICGQQFWNTFGPQTWKEIANHHHIGWLQPWKWFFGNLLAISPKSTKEVRKPLGHRGSLCANRQLPCQITMSRQQVSICIFFSVLICCKRSIVFFKYSCCIYFVMVGIFEQTISPFIARSAGRSWQIQELSNLG